VWTAADIEDMGGWVEYVVECLGVDAVAGGVCCHRGMAFTKEVGGEGCGGERGRGCGGGVVDVEWMWPV
jgi:hypothetical protein